MQLASKAAAFLRSHSCFSLKQQWHLSPDRTSILATCRLRFLELSVPSGAGRGDRRPSSCIRASSGAWWRLVPSQASSTESLASGQPGDGDRRPAVAPCAPTVAGVSCGELITFRTTCCELLGPLRPLMQKATVQRIQQSQCPYLKPRPSSVQAVWATLAHSCSLLHCVQVRVGRPGCSVPPYR